MSANEINVNDLRALAGAVFDAINDEANKNGIEQAIIAVQYDIIDNKMAKILNWPTDMSLVAQSSPGGRSAQTARGKIISAAIVFRNAYKLMPSSNIMDYSSEACPDGPIKTKGGIYIPIGTVLVLKGCSTIWYTEVGVGIGVETGNPDTDKNLAMSGARVVCDYFGEQGFLTPEVFHLKTEE